MILKNIFRMFDPLPTLIILAVALPFLIIGLVEARKTDRMVKSYAIASGTVIKNEYRSRTDPLDSARVSWSYYPVVRFKSAQGGDFIFTDDAGAYPPDFQVGDSIEVLYDPINPLDASINSWFSLWMGPVAFITVGLLPILALIGWSIWSYVRAERRFQAARQAHMR